MGQQGPAGPSATGACGPAGRIELVTCNRVKVKIKRVTRQKFTGKAVSGKVRFVTATAGPASITRGHVSFALGQLISTRRGHAKLMLAPVRPLWNSGPPKR